MGAAAPSARRTGDIAAASHEWRRRAAAAPPQPRTKSGRRLLNPPMIGGAESPMQRPLSLTTKTNMRVEWRRDEWGYIDA